MTKKHADTTQVDFIYSNEFINFNLGVWDFGHSGISIAKTMEDIHQEKVLWKPHWTCCRRDWEAPGNSLIMK